MKKHRFLICLLILIFLVGSLVFMYPLINRYYVNYRMEKVIKSHTDITQSEKENGTEEGTNVDSIGHEFVPKVHTELWNKMQRYNQKIWNEKQKGLFDAWTYEVPSFELTEYGFQDDVFGIITIPKMELRMPLYLGATWQHMADGAAQLSQTSIPIGGENTNAVIAGHRGWYGAPYFREIMKLEVGDKVIIQNPWQVLEYQVSEIQIIAPNDVEAIHIQEGRDMITLLTCHPYASGGQQRYLVLCDRILESEEKMLE